MAPKIVRVEREPVLHPPPAVAPSGRLNIYAGKFVRCANRDLLMFPKPVRQKVLSVNLRALVNKHFQVKDIFFSNYGEGCGPGIIVTLAESTLVLGGWPDKDNSVDFFIHYCGEGNDDKAVACAEDLFVFARAEQMHIAPLTREPTHLLTM